MKILSIEDHAMIRAGLGQVCAALGASLVEAGNGEEALALQRTERPQLIVMDLNLPGISGFELLRRLLDANPTARILIFSMHAEAAYAARAIRLGASGYISKNASPQELRLGIEKVAQGFSYVESEIAQRLAVSREQQKLTERDLEILRLLGEGRSFTEIGEALGLGYKTIANAASAIKSKLGVARTSDLIRMSVEMRMPAGR
jgi:two-component system, NarL family, invasion response regulator UvrY